MATNVPTVNFTDRGFIAPSEPLILAGVQADINAAFGGTLSYALTTPQGQLATSEAAVIGNVYALFTYFTQQIDPSYASGRSQDAIARIYFLERDPAEPTTLQVLCSGRAVIPLGSTIQDDAGNIYAALDAITIPSTGSAVGSFACIIPGPVAVPTATAIAIYQAVPGWDSVTVVSGTQGAETETTAAFEQRRQDSVAGNSLGAIGSIIGAVAKVPGVTDFYGYDNSSAAPVTIAGVVIPANSIYIAVAGGSQSDVAQAILSKKGGGCGMSGNTTVTAYDSNPLYAVPIPYSISYQTPSPLQLQFNVTIINGPGVPSNAATLVQNALIAAASTGAGGPRARIASVVRALSYIPAISALGAWAQVSAITVGSANTAASVFTGSISGTTLTVSSTTSGAVAIGQHLSDDLGNIPAGTVILNGSNPTWTINNPLTVASETMSGSLADQTLVQVRADQEPQLVATNIAVAVS